MISACTKVEAEDVVGATSAAALRKAIDAIADLREKMRMTFSRRFVVTYRDNRNGSSSLTWVSVRLGSVTTYHESNRFDSPRRIVSDDTS
ncbi:hypothetical protein GCM10010401_01360 [Rarobacter faecitabidus]